MSNTKVSKRNKPVIEGHVIPANDGFPHDETRTCQCEPVIDPCTRGLQKISHNFVGSPPKVGGKLFRIAVVGLEGLEGGSN